MFADYEEIRMVYGVWLRFVSFRRRSGAFHIDVLREMEWFHSTISLGTGDRIHKEDTAAFSDFWKKMNKEIEDETELHCCGKAFVQSDHRNTASMNCKLFVAWRAVRFYSNICDAFSGQKGNFTCGHLVLHDSRASWLLPPAPPVAIKLNHSVHEMAHDRPVPPPLLYG
jgi:hypothetical protein